VKYAFEKPGANPGSPMRNKKKNWTGVGKQKSSDGKISRPKKQMAAGPGAEGK